MAENDELLERPFADFNAAPATVRRELPPPPEPGAPVFSLLEEIIPKSTIMLLFRDTATGVAFSVANVRRVVKWLMAELGLDPARFGAHSLRIGGATAALAAGIVPAQIRLLGRWSSDVAARSTCA